MKYILTAILIFSFLAGTSFAESKGLIADSGDKINYSLGHQIGKDLKRQDRQIVPQAFLKGVEDALAETEPQLSYEEMTNILQGLKKNLLREQQAKQRQKQRRTKEAYRGEGREFLAQNAKKEGIITLPSGLQYKVIKAGSGKSPGPHDKVRVHYRSTLLNGIEFASSYRENEPAEFWVDGVVPGWTEALQLMKEGAKWQLFVPADLAYGERGPIADRAVIFEIELISVLPSE
jgi:FKBP-type peptidyl-prolyl cis-trans isomerase FklB